MRYRYRYSVRQGNGIATKWERGGGRRRRSEGALEDFKSSSRRDETRLKDQRVKMDKNAKKDQKTKMDSRKSVGMLDRKIFSGGREEMKGIRYSNATSEAVGGSPLYPTILSGIGYRRATQHYEAPKQPNGQREHFLVTTRNIQASSLPLPRYRLLVPKICIKRRQPHQTCKVTAGTEQITITLRLCPSTRLSLHLAFQKAAFSRDIATALQYHTMAWSLGRIAESSRNQECCRQELVDPKAKKRWRKRAEVPQRPAKGLCLMSTTQQLYIIINYRVRKEKEGDGKNSDS
ncbi:hypothetical protein MBM_09680 [Drepanopeziza brunnea f. sp. 'multigermtubi' MB_m1]|uniref:Uncharacterized protein n=1 Tax=Marssonina brunnea f. sp. multigermtubi (strain MB_m1) TaxID=1072389 RepID=K1WHB0_MARBU|nr:uncharacterized protein MBM_09680 [Drepanopeziza brunnea f. sp. 'multigermtubi' MB_m1]EKD12181.1 hypothetical protein MBM_09680 [Drepanopeziza brunnea f. sp. 'multigermtubi' MB_m1]